MSSHITGCWFLTVPSYTCLYLMMMKLTLDGPQLQFNATFVYLLVWFLILVYFNYQQSLKCQIN